MFYFPRDFDPKNHAARRWLRRIGPETYRKKPELKDDLAEELERPMPSPWENEMPRPLWELEQDAEKRDLA
ncbi:MAG: hypothetical protein HYZ11_17145 [Candidatus Tectomicrobia bacterium]|uniref:Uncharacterized protein n=1 Tax=Tectimicrobiota bacterium TaxID=2528274 RepID=A0A932I269_UNCTE|nr:hypothetical protein [Candidatus Tectomicrobia bacterium]